MIRRLLLILVAIFLGLLCDASWEKTVSGAFPWVVIIGLFLLVFALLMFDINLLPARESVWLFFPPVFFATTASLTAFQPESLKYKLSLAFVALYLGLLSMTYLGGQLRRYCLFDYLRNFYRLAVSLLKLPIQYIWQLIRDIFLFFQGDDETDDVSIKYSRRIGFWIFAALFALFWFADWAFQELHRTLLSELKKIFDLGGTNIWGIGLWSYLILGLMLYAGTQSRDEHLAVDDPKAFRHWLNYASSLLVFIAAIIPLTTFSIVRINCSLGWTGCLYSESGFLSRIETQYGFWTLVLACGLVFLLACWLNHVTVFVETWDRPVHIILNLCLFANVVVLLWTAWDSLTENVTLGIKAPQHILYAHGGLGWLGLMFFMFIVYELIERERDFPYAALRVTTLLAGAFTFIGAMVAAL